MKMKNRLKRLKRRQAEYDAMKPEVRRHFHHTRRPGSTKK